MNYKTQQKIMGTILIVISIIIPIIFNGDATVSLFTSPLGIYLLTTKEKVIV